MTPHEQVVARVQSLRDAMPEACCGRVTMAAGLAEDRAGRRIMLIGTSEARGYLRPGVALLPEEVMVGGLGHAERNIIDYAAAMGLKLLSVGATRPICQDCAAAVRFTGAELATEIKQPSSERASE